MARITAEELRAIFAALSEIMEENKQYLVALDSAVGDGDLGLTMSQGFRSAAEFVDSMDETDVGIILARAGMTIASKAPSTMGTLMGTGFMKGGRAVQGRDFLGLDELTGFLEAFLEGIMERGRCRPGEKTVVDALQPALEALKAAGGQGLPLTEALDRAYEAAAAGLEKTKDMVAQHGRPAYYGEGSRGKEDPGAAVGVFLIKGLRQGLSA